MLKLSCVAAVIVVLSGCAAFNSLNNDVSTYGPWPAERRPGSYAFERLPSQQAHPERQQLLEDAARGAVETAGFGAAADPGSAEYLMQLGARVASTDPWMYNDPLFWRAGIRAGYGYGRWGHGWGPGFGFGYGYGGSMNFEREVALLIRDRKTGQLLYEARASNNGYSASIDYLLPAMFEAAMNGFPGAGPNPRNVMVPITRQ